ncbi:hypothetical protein [Solimicrobium silvestre]|uniref:Uncharacterized protein n=1 Tax=Solimicrobium silvestre TaxID=2099400 RepID=A0A2S9H3P5_9BURK|nr:hypothetical protein [Solimicrobium silvestre]PRC94553.1 hypothetical protein S2091_0556 [Solimicrobium silvestre]
MDITISHQDFKTQLLEIRISGFFCSSRVLLNGVEVKRVQGVYTVLNDVGYEVAIELNSSLLNPIPIVRVDAEKINLANATEWSQFTGWGKTSPLQRFKSKVRMLLMSFPLKKV